MLYIRYILHKRLEIATPSVPFKSFLSNSTLVSRSQTAFRFLFVVVEKGLVTLQQIFCTVEATDFGQR